MKEKDAAALSAYQDLMQYHRVRVTWKVRPLCDRRDASDSVRPAVRRAGQVAEVDGDFGERGQLGRGHPRRRPLTAATVARECQCRIVTLTK